MSRRIPSLIYPIFELKIKPTMNAGHPFKLKLLVLIAYFLTGQLVHVFAQGHPRIYITNDQKQELLNRIEMAPAAPTPGVSYAPFETRTSLRRIPQAWRHFNSI